MDGYDFISLAGKLAAVPDADEATYRTAISRAYYGAFHIARSFLTELGFQPVGNANVHAFVQHHLNASDHPEPCLAAAQLGDLQTARNRADYNLNDAQVGSRGYAIVNVERAHSAASALNQCREQSVRTSIREAIAEYQQKLRPH